MSGMFSSSLTRMITMVLIVVYQSRPYQFQHVYSQVYTTVSFFVSITLALGFKFLCLKVLKEGNVRLSKGFPTFFLYSLAFVYSSQLMFSSQTRNVAVLSWRALWLCTSHLIGQQLV